jgi:hypothetical protein
MPARSFKGNVWGIVRSHRASYIDVRTGKQREADVIVFECLPLLGAALVLWFDVRLGTAAAVGLLTIAGLLGAFLFGVMLQVSDRAMNWADAHPIPSRDTSDDATYLEELAANAGYASLVCIAASVAFVIASVTQDYTWPLRVSSAIGLGLAMHLVLTLFMVMKRVFAFTQAKLTRARTGAGRKAAGSPRRRDAA